jgi:threonine/homoserine/homoserine lactone efflux protein
MFSMLFTAFIVGFIVAIPPGAVTIIASNLAIKNKLRYAFFFILGANLADIFYITLVYFGINLILFQNIVVKLIFLIIMGLILLYLGIDTMRIKISDKKEVIQKEKKSYIQELFYGIFITLLNPITIAGWFAVAGSFFASWHSSWPNFKYYGLLSILMMIFGVMSWMVPILLILNKIKHFISPKIIHGFSIISGIFLILLSANAFWLAIKIIIKM